MVYVATSSDPNMIRLVEMIKEGFPEDCNKIYNSTSSPATDLPASMESSSVMTRLSYPLTLSNQVLQALHLAFQTIIQIHHKAEASFFWPGMTPTINEMQTCCSPGNRMAHSHQMCPPTTPTMILP